MTHFALASCQGHPYLSITSGRFAYSSETDTTFPSASLPIFRTMEARKHGLMATSSNSTASLPSTEKPSFAKNYFGIERLHLFDLWSRIHMPAHGSPALSAICISRTPSTGSLE